MIATDERREILKIAVSPFSWKFPPTKTKYSSKNYRFLNIFKTKTTKRNKNFEHNLLSPFLCLTISEVAGCVCRFYEIEPLWS